MFRVVIDYEIILLILFQSSPRLFQCNKHKTVEHWTVGMFLHHLSSAIAWGQDGEGVRQLPQLPAILLHFNVSLRILAYSTVNIINIL